MSQSAEISYGASGHYDAAYFAWQSAGGEFGALINRHKFVEHVSPTDTVLDFGCGGGFLLNSLTCVRRIGVEVNPVAREHANRFGIECHEETSAVPDATADVIVSDHALEHVPFPIGALRELRRIVKPNGKVVIVTPVDRRRRYDRYDPSDIHHHLHHWTAQHMGNSLSEANLAVQSVRNRICAWPGRWTVACYGRLPYWAFLTIAYTYGKVARRGGELIVVARPR